MTSIRVKLDFYLKDGGGKKRREREEKKRKKMKMKWDPVKSLNSNHLSKPPNGLIDLASLTQKQ